MKTMTYLEVILWFEEHVFDAGHCIDGEYTIKYATDDEYGSAKSFGKSLIECVLKANNAELNSGNN